MHGSLMKTSTPGRPADRPEKPITDPLNGEIPGAGSVSISESVVPIDLIPPDLAADSVDLVPSFPLGALGTDLVLYGGASGELRVHWYLVRDDFEKAAASFPNGGHGASAVIRLLREHPNGGAEPFEERTLATQRDGSGEMGFQIPPDHGRYRTELGLTNQDGGWLMLARSNSLDNAVSVGLSLPTRPVLGQEPVMVMAPVFGVDTASPVSPRGGEVQGLKIDPTLEGPADAGPAESLPVRRLECARVFPLADLPDAVMPHGAPIQALIQGLGVPEQPLSVHRVSEDALQSMSGPDLVSGASEISDSAIPLRVGVKIHTLTYERPPERTVGVELEAELRISGRASPNSVIDLFGMPYWVGSGGRFQFDVRVEDPQLLRQALEAAPPPQIGHPRNESKE